MKKNITEGQENAVSMSQQQTAVVREDRVKNPWNYWDAPGVTFTGEEVEKIASWIEADVTNNTVVSLVREFLARPERVKDPADAILLFRVAGGFGETDE